MHPKHQIQRERVDGAQREYSEFNCKAANQHLNSFAEVMDLLPDDVLLEVMILLDVEDLLAARLVSKRFGSLAMNPAVWRHQILSVGFGRPCRPTLVCPVLRMAPCLRRLDVDFPADGCQFAYISTRCAVAELRLTVCKAEGFVQATAVIRAQEALGRLRILQIAFLPWNSDSVSASSTDALMMTVGLTSGLEHLDVKFPPCLPFTAANLARHNTQPRPSLKYFRWDPLDQKTWSFIHFVLSVHATTLEQVDLLEVGVGGTAKPPSTSTSTALLLSGMPNLRKLTCGMLPGLAAVAMCESLRVVKLSVRNTLGFKVKEDVATPFLRRATQLGEVELLLYNCDEPAFPYPNLILGLTSSSQSSVEMLTIRANPGWHSTRSCLKSLFAALVAEMHSLPYLRRLVVDEATDELLLGITPATAPHLETLMLWSSMNPSLSTGTPSCAHTWLHMPAIKAVLSMNTSLKLYIPYIQKYCPPTRLCELCKRGCQRNYNEIEEVDASSKCWILLPRDKFCN